MPGQQLVPDLEEHSVGFPKDEYILDLYISAFSCFKQASLLKLI